MALFDKLKGIVKDVGKTVTAAAKCAADDLSKMGNSPEAQAKREEAKQAEFARMQEEMEKEKSARLAMRDRIVNGDPNDELMEYLEDATDEEISELDRLKDERRANICETEIKRLSKNTCCDLEKGDCFWVGQSFYCTCGDTACPRKEYIRKDQLGKAIAPEHVPYIKLLSSFFRDGELVIKREDIDLTVLEAFRHFIETFLPEHRSALNWNQAIEMTVFFLTNGLGAENYVLDILFSIHQQTDGKVVPPMDFLVNAYHDIINSDDSSDYMNICMPYFKNPSLYDRSREDLEYTAKILDIVSDEEKRNAAFPVSADVSLEKLFNADGTIKDAGIGGPRKGFYGDVIYNIVSAWEVKGESL
ncbi:MAG: hypothetical protein IKW10_07330 [Oscillospiraceae bacterium]|nr:hypothetical protein [Oscillospiraceae bacterium]